MKAIQGWILGLSMSMALGACRTDPAVEDQRQPAPSPLPPQPNQQWPGVQSPERDPALVQQERRVLEALTPRVLTITSFYEDFGYSSFPSEIFARKGGVMTPEEREQERTPPGTTDSAAHRFLMRLGQQIYQQALLAKLSGDLVFADNALTLIQKLVAANLRFKNDPKNLSEVNDNRFLEISWFLSLLARGATILNDSPEAWKVEVQWDSQLRQLNAWIGEGIDQNWPMSSALQKSPLDLAAQSGLLTWVSPTDSRHGATNRSFASLEAQMRIAELRGGRLGPVRLVPNAWQTAQKAALEHDGSMAQLFATFRMYLHYYVRKPLAPTGREYSLRYAPTRDLRNTDPEVLDAMPCRDPYQFAYQADCLLNKDAYRNDTYHPQMGFASILNIIDIGKRYGLELTPNENDEVVRALRWTALQNLEGIVGKPARGIPIWELAFRFYGEERLGPYCRLERDADRAQDEHRDMALAWGFPLLAVGY